VPDALFVRETARKVVIFRHEAGPPGQGAERDGRLPT
jgi:hypothetical protein